MVAEPLSPQGKPQNHRFWGFLIPKSNQSCALKLLLGIKKPKKRRRSFLRVLFVGSHIGINAVNPFALKLLLVFLVGSRHRDQRS